MQRTGTHIALLDPSLQNNDGLQSTNLGDLIIYESIAAELNELFPGKDIIRVSSHVALGSKQRKLFNEAEISFIGGTNLLTSRIIRYMGMPIRNNDLVWLFPGISKLVIFGAGWGYGYGQPISMRTRVFYKRFLHPRIKHSLRDQYSTNKLSKEAGIRTLNTCCPTTWRLKIQDSNRTKFTNTVLFTLTDYDTAPAADEQLIQILLKHFDKLTFFPQGEQDEEYLKSLSLYQSNKEKFLLLPHAYPVFKDYLRDNDITYVGTRLHGGIKSMMYGHESMIIAFDNRSMEISKDTNLPICLRSDYSRLSDWLTGKQVFDQGISLPFEAIAEWKNQFSGR